MELLEIVLNKAGVIHNQALVRLNRLLELLLRKSRIKNCRSKNSYKKNKKNNENE